MTSGAGLEARWSCPKYKEHGCPATFSARIAICEEESGPENYRSVGIGIIKC